MVFLFAPFCFSFALKNSNIESMKDSVRVIVAGDWKFVFLFKGPIYLLCVSRTGESITQVLYCRLLCGFCVHVFFGVEVINSKNKMWLVF